MNTQPENQSPILEVSEAQLQAVLVEQILQRGNVEFGLRRLFSLAEIEEGHTGTGHGETAASTIKESPEKFRRDFYLFLPASVGPLNADKCSEVLWFSERLPAELKAEFLGLPDQDASHLVNFLTNPGGVEVLPTELQPLARQFVENPDFEDPVTVEAILHPHGQFQSANKIAISELANLDIPEVSQIARTYLWQLLSNHQFTYGEDQVQNAMFTRLEAIRDELNKQWELYLANQPDLYADRISQNFVEKPEIAQTLRELAGDYSQLVAHRKSLEAKMVENEGLVELSSTHARGVEFATSLVKHTVLKDQEAIGRLRQANTQARYTLENVASEDLRTINTDFEAGVAAHLKARLSDERFRNKIDLREVTRNLLALHGVELTTEQLLAYYFAELNPEELTHEQIATVLVTNFIAEIAEEHGLEPHIPHNHELAEALREQGLRIINTYVFSGAHGDDTMAGYHAIINQNTGQAEMCDDHAKNMDFELQLDNKDADSVLEAAVDIDYGSESENEAEVVVGVIEQMPILATPEHQGQAEPEAEQPEQAHESNIYDWEEAAGYYLAPNIVNFRANDSRDEQSSRFTSFSSLISTFNGSGEATSSGSGRARNNSPVVPISRISTGRENQQPRPAVIAGGNDNDTSDDGFNPGSPSVLSSPQSRSSSNRFTPVTPITFNSRPEIVIGSRLQSALRSTQTVTAQASEVKEAVQQTTRIEEAIQAVKQYREEEHLQDTEAQQTSSTAAAGAVAATQKTASKKQARKKAGVTATTNNTVATAAVSNASQSTIVFNEEVEETQTERTQVTRLQQIRRADALSLEIALPGPDQELDLFTGTRELQQFVYSLAA